MSVKTASRLVSRVMRVAFKETIAPANQPLRPSSTSRSLSEAGDVSRTFGSDLNEHLHAYTGSVDPFGNPSNTADSWRLQFCRRESAFEAANTSDDRRKRQGQR